MQIITIYKIKDFHFWLKRNHKKEKEVKVIVHKRHTGKPAPTHRELLEEAICFGWIDTTIKRIDEDTFSRNFVKRSDKSRWSENTLGYAKKLLADGRMSAQGIYYYKLGMIRPVHGEGIPKNPDIPDDLKKAILKSKKATAVFEKYPPSVKRMLYRWVLSGKLPETRKKRISLIVDRAKNGEKGRI